MVKLLDPTTVNNFANAKNQCLGKRDKSRAGRLDPGVVPICARINNWSEYYTTSSCSGRCFLYTGPGYKATDTFERYRVSHDVIQDPQRYFDLDSLERDPTGGGDAITAFDGGRKQKRKDEKETVPKTQSTETDNVVWLRFEPFILHVACRTLSDASKLMEVVRPIFKNVGVTTFNDSRFLVAIWGDEGLDMPLTTACGVSMVQTYTPQWLAELVNERHARNMAKMERLVQSLETFMPIVSVPMPKRFDVVGDVAILHSVQSDDLLALTEIGQAILNKNKAIKVVAVRTSNLNGSERAAGALGMQIIAGPPRSPLVTTHREYGISCVVNLQDTFFSPRMGPERLRICQQTARNEHVLVVFAGVCLDALQLVARTEAIVTAIEWNPVAVECARNSVRMMRNNKKGVQCDGAADRLNIIEGDCREVLPTLPHNHYDRIVAPRPKEGNIDGNQPHSTDHKAGGQEFLDLLLSNVKREGGVVHWYDFCANHEFPACRRTVQLIEAACQTHQLRADVLHTANVGSVAMRQLRVCVDFRVSPLA